MKYKISLRLNYLKRIFRSPSRMILTLAGLVLSVTILVMGLIYSETYMKSKLADINIYLENKACVLEGEYDYELYRQIEDRTSEIVSMQLVSMGSYTVGKVNFDNRKIDILVKPVRTSIINPDFMMLEAGNWRRYKSELVYGRLINDEDIENNSNVAVVSEDFAKIMFGDVNPTGQEFSMPVYGINEEYGTMDIKYYETLRIIGVVKESDFTHDKITSLSKSYSEISQLEFLIYVPLSCNPGNKKTSDYLMDITGYCKGDYGDFIDVNRDIISGYNTDGHINSYDYYDMRINVMSEIEEMRGIIFYIVVFMFVISGICIFNTMFFSIKERINEIGIRKSLGAFDADIVGQFIFEGFTYGIIGSAIGIFVGTTIGSVLYILLDGYGKLGVPLYISWKAVVLSAVVSLMIGILSSIIPSVHASRINIADAIRYD